MYICWCPANGLVSAATTCNAACCRYADYLYGVLMRNTEHLLAARPSGSPAALSNGAGKRSPSSAHAAGKKVAGKESKRQAQDADARHARELAQVTTLPHAHWRKDGSSSVKWL